MWKALVSLFKSKETKAREAEEAAQAEAYLEAERLRKEENLRAYRAAPTIPTTKSAPNPQRVHRSTRQKEPPVEVRGYQGGTSDNTSLTMMAAMVAFDDTPTRSSHSNNYCTSNYSNSDSSSSYSSSDSGSSSSSSCD